MDFGGEDETGGEDGAYVGALDCFDLGVIGVIGLESQVVGLAECVDANALYYEFICVGNYYDLAIGDVMPL